MIARASGFDVIAAPILGMCVLFISIYAVMEVPGRRREQERV